MQRCSVVLALVFCLAAPVLGKDWKERIFAAAPEACYAAADRAISKHHQVLERDEDRRAIRYQVGTTAWSWGYRMTLSIESAPEENGAPRCRARTAVEKKGGSVFSWGSGKKEVRKVYDWVQEELEH